MRVHSALIAPCLVAALSTCTAARDESAHADEPGDVVQELGDELWIVFQDKQNAHWFGSNGQGVYRVEGGRIVRYTTKDGLCNDSIRQIEEDDAGNLYFATSGGISKFDRRRFTTLVPIEGSEWKLEPGDLWFKGSQDDNGPYRYDGKSLYRLEFPKSELEDGYRAEFPAVPYSPYGIYTVVRESRGAVWFGTACFGACRYDGKSFTWVSEPELTELDDGPSLGVRGIVEDKEGKIWLSHTEHRYAVDSTTIPYRKEEGIVGPGAPGEADDSYFVSGVRDRQGVLWLATYGAGVWRYDGERVTRYPVQDGGRTALLFSIHEDHQGVLWLGSTQSGAYRFDGETFARFRP